LFCTGAAKNYQATCTHGKKTVAKAWWRCTDSFIRRVKLKGFKRERAKEVLQELKDWSWRAFQ